MTKLILITLIVLASRIPIGTNPPLHVLNLGQPAFEPVVEQTVVKIDDQTCEITTTTTTETVVRRDRAELQTELDHIPDRKAEIQKQLDVVNEREAELIEILNVFK